MGNFLSSLFGFTLGKESKVSPKDLGPEADIPDSDSSLTPREVAYIRETWGPVQLDLKSYGAKFFILLFETHPELQTRFKGFAGKTPEELLESKRLMAHGATVFGAFDSYITNLDDVETVVEMLKTTGENHKNRGIKKTDFPLLSPVLIKFLCESLGPAWSSEAEKAWEKLLNVVMSIVMSVYD